MSSWFQDMMRCFCEKRKEAGLHFEGSRPEPWLKPKYTEDRVLGGWQRGAAREVSASKMGRGKRDSQRKTVATHFLTDCRGCDKRNAESSLNPRGRREAAQTVKTLIKGITNGRDKGRTTMAKRSKSMEKKTMNAPDEVRSFDKGRLDLATVGAVTFGRATLQPGWKWSESVKPVVKTELCEAPHTQYHVSGRLHVKMADGSELEFGPGDVSMLPPGHDAWVVGDEPAVVIDISGMQNYAKPAARRGTKKPAKKKVARKNR